jgi:anti-sigma factor RsiW
MQQLNQSADCVSNLELDEWQAHELSALDEQRVVQHLADCERCRSRHATLLREQAAFFAAAPSFHEHAERFVAGAATSLRDRSEPAGAAATSRGSARVAIGPWAIAATLAALLCLTLVPVRPSLTRPKGDPHLGFFVKRERAVTRGANGDTVYPNDLIRFVYTGDRSYYLAIFNLDARAATVYFPSGGQAEQILAGNDVALDFSVQLDEQLGSERVVGVFCAAAFPIEPLRAALAATHELPALAAGCHRDVITLNKAAGK